VEEEEDGIDEEVKEEEIIDEMEEVDDEELDASVEEPVDDGLEDELDFAYHFNQFSVRREISGNKDLLIQNLSKGIISRGKTSVTRLFDIFCQKTQVESMVDKPLQGSTKIALYREIPV
jgi:hypothetical protein